MPLQVVCGPTDKPHWVRLVAEGAPKTFGDEFVDVINQRFVANVEPKLPQVTIEDNPRSQIRACCRAVMWQKVQRKYIGARQRISRMRCQRILDIKSIAENKLQEYKFTCETLRLYNSRHNIHYTCTCQCTAGLPRKRCSLPP